MKTGKGAFAVKALVLLVWMILISALESSVMVHLKILGQVPKGLPFVVAAAAVLDGPMAGVLAGAAAGRAFVFTAWSISSAGRPWARSRRRSSAAAS